MDGPNSEAIVAAHFAIQQQVKTTKTKENDCVSRLYNTDGCKLSVGAVAHPCTRHRLCRGPPLYIWIDAYWYVY